MPQKTDWKSGWKVAKWNMEEPSGPAVARDLAAGVPSVEFQSKGGRRVTVVFERSGELREVRFAGPNLTVETVRRQVRLGELVDEARRYTQETVSVLDTMRSDQDRERDAELRQRLRTSKNPTEIKLLERELSGGSSWWDLVEGFARPSYVGAPPLSDFELAQTARDYVDRCVNGQEKVSALARSMGMSQPGLSTRLSRCRERGILGGVPQRGKAVGWLTPKAKRILKQVEQRAGGTNV